jgi:hypothetical protein
MSDWITKLSKEDQSAIRTLGGAMWDMPKPEEFASLAHLLHEVRGRIGSASSLITQADMVLKGGEYFMGLYRTTTGESR